MAEFEVEGHRYRSEKLNGRTQFHIARRLAPVLGSFKDILQQIEVNEAGEINLKDSLEAAMPLARALAEMKEEDADYILDACLKMCKRSNTEGTSWFPVWNVTARKEQFDDMTMMELIQICRYVLEESLASFFPTRRSISSTGSESV